MEKIAGEEFENGKNRSSPTMNIIRTNTELDPAGVVTECAGEGFTAVALMVDDNEPVGRKVLAMAESKPETNSMLEINSVMANRDEARGRNDVHVGESDAALTNDLVEARQSKIAF